MEGRLAALAGWNGGFARNRGALIPSAAQWTNVPGVMTELTSV